MFATEAEDPRPSLLARLTASEWLERVLSVGIDDETPLKVARKVRTTNVLAVTGIVFGLCYFALLLVIGVGAYAMSMPVCVAGFGWSLWLNHQRRVDASRLVFHLLATGAVISLAMLDRTAHMHFILVAVACIPFLIYQLEEQRRLVGSFLLPTAAFLLIELGGNVLLPEPVLSDRTSRLFALLTGPTVFISIAISMIHLSRANQRSETSLRLSLAKLEQETASRMQHERIAADEREKARVARAAGMAEIATGVLHNVGNILNSVNVSSCLLEERLRTSNGPSLARAATLVRQGGADVPEKRAQLAQYLDALARKADQERDELSAESVGLRKNIEHIHSVVTMQQDFSRALGVVESVLPRAVAEEAVTLYAGSRERHQVLLQMEHEDLPEVLMDRHKVLQILVNLVRNAVDALKENPDDDRRLEVRTTRRGPELVFEVRDNGTGIAEENQIKIFHHGFTTKIEGHGFGLHASSCLAKEMHGALTCHSEGTGKGSTFTLTVPFRPASERPS